MKLDWSEPSRRPVTQASAAPRGAPVEEGESPQAARLSGAVATAAALVGTRYSDGLNVREVAKLLGVDRSRLSAAFREQTGFTLHQYIVRVRLQAGVAMIAAGTKIEAVALLVGYRDKSSFYRQFRRVLRSTPKACRPGSQATSSVPPGRVLREELRGV